MRAALGHSYNGYYSGLLIRQIRVRIPGGPLKIWLRRLNRLGRWSRLPARSLLNACQRARSNLSRRKCRVQSLRSTPVGAEPTSTRTSCAPSELLWATSITELQGLLRLLIRVRIPGGSYPALSTKWIRLPHSHCGDTGSVSVPLRSVLNACQRARSTPLG